jgi:hypothetical protein
MGHKVKVTVEFEVEFEEEPRFVEIDPLHDEIVEALKRFTPEGYAHDVSVSIDKIYE